MLDYCLEKAAELPMHYRQRLYCVVTDKRGRVIGESGNSFTRTHTVQAKYAKRAGKPGAVYAHAECMALLRAAKSGSDPHKVWVARIGWNKKPALAKPCAICELMIKEFPTIKSVEYTV